MSAMSEFLSSSYLFGSNAPFVEELYESWLADAQSVPQQWREYFDRLQAVPGNGRDIAHAPVVAAFAQRARSGAVRAAPAGLDRKQNSVLQLIAEYRFRGCLLADLDPLKRQERVPIPELEPGFYDLTEAGRVEIHDWLTDLIATPVNDYPAFEAALSFLPALPPGAVVDLLRERSLRLEFEITQDQATRELSEKQGLPRLFEIEGEFRTALREAELDFVRRLVSDIERGNLDGVEWWTRIHEDGDTQTELPAKLSDLKNADTKWSTP